MPRMIAFKVLQAAPVILIISVLAFFLMILLPGDPAVVIAGDQAPPEAIEAVRRQLGLDRPYLEQLGLWFLNLAQGNFGASLVGKENYVGNDAAVPLKDQTGRGYYRSDRMLIEIFPKQYNSVARDDLMRKAGCSRHEEFSFDDFIAVAVLGHSIEIFNSHEWFDSGRHTELRW